jgi:hypothetical protein
MNNPTTWLDDLLSKLIAVNGVALPNQPYLNFIGGVTAVDNPDGLDGIGSTDVTITPAVSSGTSVTLSYGGTTSYTVILTDLQIVFDASGWTGSQAALEALLPVAPFVGMRVEFVYDGWSSALPPPPRVNGNGNPIVPYAPFVRTSAQRVDWTAITDQGVTAAWRWSGAVWFPA